LGSPYGNHPTARRYNSTRVFLTFPFPHDLTPNLPAADYADDPRAIATAKAARRLNELREARLNPSDLVERVPEVVPGFPDRIVPVSPKAAAILKKRTLTNLYNERPARQRASRARRRGRRRLRLACRHRRGGRTGAAARPQP
jgi:integrase